MSFGSYCVQFPSINISFYFRYLGVFKVKHCRNLKDNLLIKFFKNVLKQSLEGMNMYTYNYVCRIANVDAIVNLVIDLYLSQFLNVDIIIGLCNIL